jgi:hypothetical protein
MGLGLGLLLLRSEFLRALPPAVGEHIVFCGRGWRCGRTWRRHSLLASRLAIDSGNGALQLAPRLPKRLLQYRVLAEEVLAERVPALARGHGAGSMGPDCRECLSQRRGRPAQLAPALYAHCIRIAAGYRAWQPRSEAHGGMWSGRLLAALMPSTTFRDAPRQARGLRRRRPTNKARLSNSDPIIARVNNYACDSSRPHGLLYI